jgi:hypothetical protein
MLIWKDVRNREPDIFLSIGTGHHGRAEDPSLPSKGSGLIRRKELNRSRKEEPMPTPNVPVPTARNFTALGQLWNTATSVFDNILNCTKIWNDFRVDFSRQRYIRINPDLGFPVPKLDDVERMPDVQKAVHEQMHTNARVKEIAHRLIASTFFFEKTEASTKEREGGYECYGV